ncbi:19349_t:CDS:2 [Gigaspora rosea]|nr:19349_t:CDS:2 [Gigaspora rosea]
MRFWKILNSPVYAIQIKANKVQKDTRKPKEDVELNKSRTLYEPKETANSNESNEFDDSEFEKKFKKGHKKGGHEKGNKGRLREETQREGGQERVQKRGQEEHKEESKEEHKGEYKKL